MMETRKLEDGTTVDLPQAGLDPLLSWHPAFTVQDAGLPDRYMFMIRLRSEYFLWIQADEDDLLQLTEQIQQAIRASHERFTGSKPSEAPCERCRTTRTDSGSR